MSEQKRQLSLDDSERAALIMVVALWLEENDEETHSFYQEVRQTYHALIKL